MLNANFIILYVADPTASARFYADLTGREPVEASPTFAMFALASGLMLGLWKADTVEPKATLRGGGGELGLTVADADAVAATFADFSARGLPILQPLTRMDFGPTFVTHDPDGHRLRVFAAGG
ncbi:MAG: VOC family protein [Hyphomicrobiaceae bacterium]|nr:VOC family protein [Hyphomicrobiaceae bacterium]